MTPGRTRNLLAAGLAVAAVSIGGSDALGQAAGTDACRAAGGPLVISNENVLRQPYFRSRPTAACPAQALTIDVGFGAANHFLDARDGPRAAFVDAETYRLDAALALPLGQGREIRVAVPFRARTSGVLDGLIETWHELFGLPRGTRPDHPRDQVAVEVSADEGTAGSTHLLTEGDPAAGPGDVSVTFLQRLHPTDGRSATAMRASVKLPTGGPHDLLGSGAVDLAVGVAVTRTLAEGLWLHGNLDVVALGSSALASGGLRQATTVAELLAAVEWRAARLTSLLVQMQSESTPLLVGVDLLDRDALLLAWGIRHQLRPGLQGELGIAEDLRVQTAPDFSIQAGLRWVAR